MLTNYSNNTTNRFFLIIKEMWKVYFCSFSPNYLGSANPSPPLPFNSISRILSTYLSTSYHFTTNSNYFSVFLFLSFFQQTYLLTFIFFLFYILTYSSLILPPLSLLSLKHLKLSQWILSYFFYYSSYSFFYLAFSSTY